MTPKEKAEELVNKMKYPMNGVYVISHIANELALIAVDEILKITWVDKFLTVEDYWNEVKQEIEKL
jgi:hypothetical protein